MWGGRCARVERNEIISYQRVAQRPAEMLPKIECTIAHDVCVRVCVCVYLFCLFHHLFL